MLFYHGIFLPKACILAFYYNLIPITSTRVRIALKCITVYVAVCVLIVFFVQFAACRPLSTIWYDFHLHAIIPRTHTSNVSLLTQIPFAGPQVQIIAPFPEAGHFSTSIVHLIFLVMLWVSFVGHSFWAVSNTWLENSFRLAILPHTLSPPPQTSEVRRIRYISTGCYHHSNRYLQVYIGQYFNWSYTNMYASQQPNINQDSHLPLFELLTKWLDLWAAAEYCVSMIVVCLPSLKPLIKGLGDSMSRTIRGSSWRRTRVYDTSPTIEGTYKNGVTTITRAVSEDGSQVELRELENAILKTSTFLMNWMSLCPSREREYHPLL